MSEDPSNFIRAMRQFSSAVSVITTGEGEARAGFTATAVLSLTAEPPQIGVAVNKTVSAYEKLLKARCFCVNTLASGQDELARRFAGGVKGIERFATGEWTVLRTGAPVLSGALINFDCTLENTIEFSTHTLLVGRVVETQLAASARPLLFVDGQWAGLVPGTQADIDRVRDAVQDSIREVDDALVHNDNSAAALAEFVQRFTESNIAQQSAAREHQSSELYASPQSLKELRQSKKAFDERVYQLVKRGVDEGRFHVSDARLASFAIVGMVTWTHKWFRESGRLRSQEVARALSDLALKLVEAKK
jgi:flavin reductase (DIM6/NTAB) family NADH-FMN oxidoreductase RutF